MRGESAKAALSKGRPRRSGKSASPAKSDARRKQRSRAGSPRTPSAIARLIDRSGETLKLTDRAIRRIAHERLPESSIARIVLKQAFYENWLKIRKRVDFRSDENADAVRAYCAMSIQEFDGINARQRWANWRTVAKNLNGTLPNRPLRAIDLCCGTGHSTEVLATYCAPGSTLLGLEFNEDFVQLARLRTYLDQDGNEVRAEFRAQSVLETFRDASGAAVPPASVDLVNCCGAVGHHFRPDATRTLADEVKRVLKPGGLALIDSGRAGTGKRALLRIFRERGFVPVRSARSNLADRYLQICFKKL
jgi:SAM-dependent methyltransferase